jgi:hypothetical protein
MSNYNLNFKPHQPLVRPPPLRSNGGIDSSVNAMNEINANKQYDSCVGQGATCGQVTVNSGQKGGWPHWGCMSGGKYRKNRSTRRRTNKRRRMNKRKGTKKRR